MTFEARLVFVQSAFHHLGRRAKAAWRSGRPRDATVQWMLGVSAIIIAAMLFLTSALSLGIMLNHLRREVQHTERAQMFVLETRGIEDDLDDAEGAARHYLAGDGRVETEVVRHESRNARRRLDGLIAAAGPGSAAQQQLTAILPLMNKELAALGQGHFIEDGRNALVAFRTRQATALADYRTDTNRQFVSFIALALTMALIGPGLGLIGISLLQRDRIRRKNRELQSELMHVQRLAVMGETAAMLAHEVSHPLTAASNYLAALRRTATQGDYDRTADLSERAVQQIHRAATILQRLRRFIEKRDAERTAVAPAVLVQDAVALLGPLDSDVTLTTDIDPRLPAVAIDRIQIQQVLVNLIRNAVEAMQGCTLRRLSIAAIEVAPGQILFSLSDTGPGLSKDAAARLFQPFFTTKKEGMGVGLSICRSIIAEHRGTIWAEPNPQGGTVFRFRLPSA